MTQVFHCISRVVDRHFVLGDTEREHFVALVRRLEGFQGLRAVTYCVMSNHFHTREEVEAEVARGGKLPLRQAIRCRVRYLSDGAVFGSAAFVEAFFARERWRFGPGRKSGARPDEGSRLGGPVRAARPAARTGGVGPP